METTAKINKVVMKSFFINLDLIDVNNVTLIFIMSALHPHQEHLHGKHPVESHQRQLKPQVPAPYIYHRRPELVFQS